MRYFITGGAGFIGSMMADRLLAEAPNAVGILDNFSSGREEFIRHHFNDPRFRLFRGDLLDLASLQAAMADYDVVMHFAANPDIARSVEEPELDHQQGTVATFHVLEAMRANGLSRLVYSSGSGVYGDIGYTEVHEDFGPLLPISMYGASKLACEAMISAFCHLYDLQAWIFRFANVVGGRQTHGVGYDFIRKLRHNPRELHILGDGSQSKSYIHVSDVVAAMLAAMAKATAKVNIFNVATQDYLDVKTIADIVAEEMGLKGIAYSFTGGSRGWKGDVPVVRFNLDRLHSLGIRAQHSSAEAVRLSIREMLAGP